VLHRVYTQNIDGLELKAGLHTSLEIHPNHGPARCIPLHGVIEELRCPGCGSIFMLEPYYPQLIGGQFPECAKCKQFVSMRVQEGKRMTTVLRLRPNVILYGEEHTHGEEIARLQQDDIDVVDFLLVVGTSLKVKGTNAFIKRCSRIIHQNNPSISDLSPSPRVIYLNDTFTDTATWNNVLDVWLEMDCEEFARLGLNIIQEVSDGGDKDGSINQIIGDRKLNYRPSWRS
jgi:NAD-dependent SIR2 family protein deacetylase